MNPSSPANKPAPENTFAGKVTRYHSNFYYVVLTGENSFPDTTFECSLKGLLKKALKAEDEAGTVVVGDRVLIDNLDPANKTARIVEIEPRRNLIPRPKIANVDQVIVVHPAKEPAFDTTQVDRYLTRIALSGLPATLCVSKSDLADPISHNRICDLYETKLGYPVVFTSIFQPEKLAALKEAAHGKTSVFAGPSGGGKSSLLNALKPELNLKVGDVSAKIERGQHTTRHVELVPIEESTTIADTPGFSQLRFDDVMPRDVESAFMEFEPYRSQCAFSDCLHKDEEGCAVREHIGDAIPQSRYDSYLVFMIEAHAYKQQTQESSEKSEYGYKQVAGKGKILRLKEKNREASRRTQRQHVTSMLDDIHDEDPETEE